MFDFIWNIYLWVHKSWWWLRAHCNPSDNEIFSAYESFEHYYQTKQP